MTDWQQTYGIKKTLTKPKRVLPRATLFRKRSARGSIQSYVIYVLSHFSTCSSKRARKLSSTDLTLEVSDHQHGEILAFQVNSRVFFHFKSSTSILGNRLLARHLLSIQVPLYANYHFGGSQYLRSLRVLPRFHLPSLMFLMWGVGRANRTRPNIVTARSRVRFLLSKSSPIVLSC